MHRYLLDTGPLSGYLLGHKRATTLISPWVANKEVVTSDLAYAEFYEFIQDFPDFHMQSAALLALVLGPIPTMSLDYPIYHRYTHIRRQLRPMNALIGMVDPFVKTLRRWGKRKTPTPLLS